MKKFVEAGEYAINLDAMAYCIYHKKDNSVQIRFIGQPAGMNDLLLGGTDAKNVWDAATTPK
jgi:hypothetical protein